MLPWLNVVGYFIEQMH